MTTTIDFTRFYIVRRFETKSGEAGISYDPFQQVGNTILAVSNRATDDKTKYISVNALIAGLKRRDYRLVPKSE